MDEYTIGYILGKKYAEDMYKHKGLTPIMKDLYELPDGLDVMKLKESLMESVEDDISALLDDSSLTDDEKVSKIHDLFMGTSDTKQDDGSSSQDDDVYVPDDVIVMRNGAIDTDSLLIGAHVIDENVGNEIRKELGVTPKDPDWGMSSSEDAMIREAFPIISDIFKKMPQDGKELTSTGETMKNKIEGRIRRSREGIIDWKKALEEFISERSHTYEKGPLRKNVYQRTGIGLKHRVRAYSDFNKCVVYIDTSGSVNNRQTQLIPIMAGEIGKIMQDCHFNTVDIHLFDDVVYNEHFDVDSYTVQDEDWGIEGADDGGGTNIHEVYKHIIKNYMDNGEIRYDINAIIIITDVSGMQSSGNVKPFVSKLGKSVLERMLYVIYNDYQGLYLKEVTEEMDSLVSDLSRHYEISVENFVKQILQESMITNRKNKKIYEALGGLKGIKAKQQAAQIDPAERTEAEKEERLRKSDIQGARAIGQLDKLLPELFANLEKYFPNCKMVKEYTAVMATDNTYYVTDDAHVILHCDITSANIKDLCEASGLMQIDQLIGNVSIKNTRSFTEFPPSFPQEIGGDFTIFNLPMLRSLKNAPKAVTGRVSVNVCYPMSKYINKAEQNDYVSSIRSTMSSLDDLENKPKSIFTMSTKKNESVQDIIANRIKASESFINEMALPHQFGTFMPRKAKPQSGSGFSEEDYLASTELYKRNRSILFDVIAPLINIPLGDIDDRDVSVITDLQKVRESNRTTNWFAKHKDDIKGYKQLDRAGVRIFTTSDDKISAVYAQAKSSDDPVLVFLTDENGDPITDGNQIQKEIDWRFEVFQQTHRYLNSLGINPNNLPDITDLGGGRKAPMDIEYLGLHFLYFVMVLLNGTGGSVDYKFKPDTLLYKDILSAGSDKQIFDSLVDEALGSVIRDDGKSYTIRMGNGGRVSVNFNQSTDKPHYAYKVNFNEAYFHNSDNDNTTVYRFFNDDFIKAILIGSSLRGYDDEPRYNLDQIIDADRETLLDMISGIADVKVVITALKSMSYEGKSKDPKTYSHSNPFDLLMMFPDKCEKEYAIRVDVDKEALDMAAKQITRKIYQSGTYTDIPRSTYDRATGQRTRNDIKGMATLKREGSKIASKSEVFELLMGSIDYIVNNKSVFADVKSVIKDAIDQKKVTDDWYENKILIRQIDSVIDDIENYSNLVKTAIVNDPELSEKKSDVISVMNDDFDTIVTNIGNIVSPEDENDYDAIISSGEALVNAAQHLSNDYENLVGTNARYTKMMKKKLGKLSDRKRAGAERASKMASTQPTGDNVISKYANIVDNISNLSVKVGDVAESIDFAGASDDAVDYFGTKENMVRRLDTQLNKAIEAMNAIKLGGDQDWIKSTMDQAKIVYDLCMTITTASDEELITDTFVDLDGACRTLSKAARGFAPSQTYKAAGAATA